MDGGDLELYDRIQNSRYGFFFDDCGTKARALNEKICEDALVIWLSSKKAYLIMMIGVEMVLTWSLVDVIILECQNLCSGRLKASADRLLGVQ